MVKLRAQDRISPGHVIWAYDRTIWELKDEGKSVAEIRAWMREECGIHVGEAAIRAVLAGGRPWR